MSDVNRDGVRVSISRTKTVVIAVVAFAGGLAVANLPDAAATASPRQDLSTRRFTVVVDEVRKTLVAGDEFSGTYSRTVRLADGTRRLIDLTPVMRDGTQVIRVTDSGRVAYMPINGTLSNGRLVVQVQDTLAFRAMRRTQDWR